MFSIAPLEKYRNSKNFNTCVFASGTMIPLKQTVGEVSELETLDNDQLSNGKDHNKQ
jgi:hypothetical protein